MFAALGWPPDPPPADTTTTTTTIATTTSRATIRPGQLARRRGRAGEVGGPGAAPGAGMVVRPLVDPFVVAQRRGLARRGKDRGETGPGGGGRDAVSGRGRAARHDGAGHAGRGVGPHRPEDGVGPGAGLDAGEGPAHGHRRLRPVGRTLGEEVPDRVAQRRRRVRSQAAHVGRRHVQVLHRGGHVGRADERRLTGEHLEQHDAEGVQVGPGIGLVALDLLRAQVSGRAEDGAGPGEVHPESLGRLGDSEVGDLYPWHVTALAPVEQHVSRLDVAVDQAGGVGVGQGIGDLAADAGGHPRRHGPAVDEALAQGFAPDQLHDDEGRAVSRHAGVVGRDHVRMGQAGGRHRFVLEPFEEALVAGEVGMEDLDGHGAGQDLVVAFPHRRHAALGHQPYQAVTAAEPAVRVGERCRRVRDSHGTPGYPSPGRALTQGSRYERSNLR